MDITFFWWPKNCVIVEILVSNTNIPLYHSVKHYGYTKLCWLRGLGQTWFIRSTKSSNTYFNFEILKHLQQILAFLINWDTKLLYHVYTSSHVFGSIHLNFIHCCLPKNLRNWVSCKWFFEVRSQWFLEFFSLSLKKVQFNFKVVLDMWLLCCGSWCAELGCPLDMFIVFHA